jgi:Ser/Thr protein kinase RdoA (MazF antagonist)
LVRQIEPLGNAGGWSGSRLWRLADADGKELCLRRWPQEHPSPERLRVIHAVLGLVGFELPIVAYPLRTVAEATVVEHGGHLWELTHWLPGIADYHSHPNPPRLAAAMQTLARFHDLAARYQRRLGVAPAIADRQRRLLGMRQKGLPLIERSLASPLHHALDNRAARIFALVTPLVDRPAIVDALSTAPEIWLQPAIRDIHHDHVLFTSDAVTGLIDFGAMRIDTPLTDVARLVGSLLGDDLDMRRFAMDAYSQIRPLSDSDCRLIDVLDESGLVIGALNWLVWLYVEHRDMGPIEPIVRRLDQLLMRLQTRTCMR